MSAVVIGTKDPGDLYENTTTSIITVITITNNNKQKNKENKQDTCSATHPTWHPA